MMSFRVVDGGGPGGEERDGQLQRDWVEEELSGVIRDVAANMLRIIRGAGKPYDLLRQIKTVVEVADRFQHLHQRFPSDIIANILRLESEAETIIARVREGDGFSQSDVDRWLADGTFEKMWAEHTVLCGSLQIIASDLVGQTTQKTAGQREFRDGLREVERVRADRRQKAHEGQRAGRNAIGPPKGKGSS
jgi:hypothetical protein